MVSHNTNADETEEEIAIEAGDTVTVTFQNYPGESPKETLTGKIMEVHRHAVDMVPEDGSDKYWDAYLTEETDRVRVYKDSRVVKVYHPDRGTKNYAKLGQRAEVILMEDEDPEIRTDGGVETHEAEEEREASEADVDVPAEDADRVAVEYHSAHVDRRKILVGSVKDVVLKGAPRDGEWVAMLAEIYVRPEDGHRNDRSDHYTETTRSAMRRVTWEIESERPWHSVEARNGLRWNRLNETGTETTLAVLAAEEEPPHPNNEISVAVGLRCHRCNATSCKEVTDPETEPLTGTRWACPHCHEIDDETGAEIGQQYEILGSKPVTHVEVSWSLHQHEAVEWAASPKRWRAFTECVIKGRKATEYAEETDVTPGTVYRHVHDARETLRGGLNE